MTAYQYYIITHVHAFFECKVPIVTASCPPRANRLRNLLLNQSKCTLM